MRVKSKMIITLLLITLLMLSMSTIAFAKDDYTPDEFKGEIDTEATGTTDVKNIGGKIIGMIRVIGTMISVGMFIVLGIKYMMGSAEERAEYKKTLFPYLIGAIMIFATTSLVDIIYNWASSL